METRTTDTDVTFQRPFRLVGYEGQLPAGTYTMSILEEPLDMIFTTGWRRIASHLRVTREGDTEYVPVDREDFLAALARDAASPIDRPEVPPKKQRMRKLLRLRLPHS
jgi:hypothetical protein